jgi:hypothetical protein
MRAWEESGAKLSDPRVCTEFSDAARLASERRECDAVEPKEAVGYALERDGAPANLPMAFGNTTVLGGAGS